MSLCPSCGREAGSHVTCPYCGANLKRRLTISLFGFLAVVLAIGGLALLWYVSVNTPIPVVRIGQIQATMNYAYVRVEGIVTRGPAFNADSESLAFWVDDGSGRLLVSAFRSDARALIETDRVPAIGDRVSVQGALRVREDTPSLTIAAVDRLARATDSAPARDLGSLTSADALTGVSVRGQVRAVREPRAGLRLITIRDASGEIDVAIDADIARFGDPAPEVQVGDSIAATGVVTLFEDTPQITLTRGAHLSLSSEPFEIAELRSIRDIGDEEIGEWVRVQGAIARIAPFSAGVKFTLSDAQDRDIVLLVWQDVFESLPDAGDWQIGAEVVARGKVNAFRGELEIVPEIALDVSVLTRVATMAPATLSLTRIGAISHADLGKSVFISGTIDSVDRFSGGLRLRLEDESGSIRVVLFDEVLEQVEESERLEEGASASALGRVSEFSGALEVIPANGASVRVGPGPEVAQVTPTPGPPRPPATPPATSAFTPAPARTPTPESGVTAIGSIDGSRIGQPVTVRGRVVATGSFREGFRFTLDDGSGSIQLVLFDGRYRELEERAALNLGAQIRVRASVVEFDGQLELQPETGGDVIVERPGSSSIVKTRAINTLSSADLGMLTAIVGDVLRVEGFSAGVSVFVNDGSGELRVAIFSNVLNHVPNAPSLQAGAKVRVVGRVDEFNGVLELIPALGYDVTINP